MREDERYQLVMQATKLYTLGIQLENSRKKLQKLVQKNVSYHSPEMHKALKVYQALDSQWKQLEREHMQLRLEMGIGETA